MTDHIEVRLEPEKKQLPTWLLFRKNSVIEDERLVSAQEFRDYGTP
jgi:hypothetical protein